MTAWDSGTSILGIFIWAIVSWWDRDVPEVNIYYYMAKKWDPVPPTQRQVSIGRSLGGEGGALTRNDAARKRINVVAHLL